MMNSPNVTSYTEFKFQLSRPRKKARRSCLYCQKAHKTCGKIEYFFTTLSFLIIEHKLTKVTGNERPCGQCVSRNMPSECVDGIRKPPKYLKGEGTKEAARGKLHRDAAFSEGIRNQQAKFTNVTNEG
jgi:hypothetical protein